MEAHERGAMFANTLVVLIKKVDPFSVDNAMSDCLK